MKNIIKISIVNYLNSIPFRYGLENYNFDTKIELQKDIPSQCAYKLKMGLVDIGLIPVAAIPEIENAKIISNFCIGANGNVKTVALYSNQPVENISTIILDYHSRTSVQLARILALHKWKINPKWEKGEEGFEKNIDKEKAGVVIGDKTFAIENKYNFKYDLANEWKEMTSLPFVFACWVSNKELPVEFLRSLNSALEYGIMNIDASVDLYRKDICQISDDEAKKYLIENINYNLDNDKKRALDYYFKLSEKIISNPFIQ
ncbi:MAG: menaquinone biosynthesis protein [Bacteroidota bacterium]